MNFFHKLKSGTICAGQKVAVAMAAPTKTQSSIFLLAIGVLFLSCGSVELVFADREDLEIDNSGFAAINCAIIKFIEGPFGALIMIIAGIGAIVSSAFGQYRAAIGLLVVAVGAFILRSLVQTFFGGDVLGDCDDSFIGS